MFAEEEATDVEETDDSSVAPLRWPRKRTLVDLPTTMATKQQYVPYINCILTENAAEAID